MGLRARRHFYNQRDAEHRNLQLKSKQNQIVAGFLTLPQAGRTLFAQELHRELVRHQVSPKPGPSKSTMALGQSYLPASKLPPLHP